MPAQRINFNLPFVSALMPQMPRVQNPLRLLQRPGLTFANFDFGLLRNFGAVLPPASENLFKLPVFSRDTYPAAVSSITLGLVSNIGTLKLAGATVDTVRGLEAARRVASNLRAALARTPAGGKPLITARKIFVNELQILVNGIPVRNGKPEAMLAFAKRLNAALKGKLDLSGVVKAAAALARRVVGSVARLAVSQVVRGGRITSRMGWRRHPITGRRSYHSGIDIAASAGTAIRAIGGGRVISVGYQSKIYGSRSVLVDEGNGVTVLYGHCSSALVRPGDTISAGQTIARVGSRGWSTGNHLHLERRRGGRAVAA